MLSGNLSYSNDDKTMKFMIMVDCKIIGVFEVYIILILWLNPSAELSFLLRDTVVYHPSRYNTIMIIIMVEIKFMMFSPLSRKNASDIAVLKSSVKSLCTKLMKIPSKLASLSFPAIVIGENICHMMLSAILIAMNTLIPCPSPCFSMTSSSIIVMVDAIISCEARSTALYLISSNAPYCPPTTSPMLSMKIRMIPNNFIMD